jgi:hypothetical protein
MERGQTAGAHSSQVMRDNFYSAADHIYGMAIILEILHGFHLRFAGGSSV